VGKVGHEVVQEGLVVLDESKHGVVAERLVG
jgi:hypothetical protein